MSTTVQPDLRGAWVQRVLGVAVVADGGVPGGQPSESRNRAEDARREIAAGLGGLSMAFRKARLSWGKARNSAHDSIRTLRDGLRDALKDDPEYPAMNTAISGLDDAMAGLDDRLETALDDAMNVRDRAAQTMRKQEVLKIIAEYRSYVEGNTVLMRIDTNPFMPLPVHALLSGELAAMGEELA